jgi:hypothetical protein
MGSDAPRRPKPVARRSFDDGVPSRGLDLLVTCAACGEVHRRSALAAHEARCHGGDGARETMPRREKAGGEKARRGKARRKKAARREKAQRKKAARRERARQEAEGREKAQIESAPHQTVLRRPTSRAQKPAAPIDCPAAATVFRADHQAGPSHRHPAADRGQRVADTSLRSPRPANALTYCPDCGARVRVDRLERHLARVHGKPARRAGAPAASRPTAPPPPTGRGPLADMERLLSSAPSRLVVVGTW